MSTHGADLPGVRTKLSRSGLKPLLQNVCFFVGQPFQAAAGLPPGVAQASHNAGHSSKTAYDALRPRPLIAWWKASIFCCCSGVNILYIFEKAFARIAESCPSSVPSVAASF